MRKRGEEAGKPVQNHSQAMLNQAALKKVARISQSASVCLQCRV